MARPKYWTFYQRNFENAVVFIANERNTYFIEQRAPYIREIGLRRLFVRKFLHYLDKADNEDVHPRLYYMNKINIMERKKLKLERERTCRRWHN